MRRRSRARASAPGSAADSGSTKWNAADSLLQLSRSCPATTVPDTQATGWKQRLHELEKRVEGGEGVVSHKTHTDSHRSATFPRPGRCMRCVFHGEPIINKRRREKKKAHSRLQLVDRLRNENTNAIVCVPRRTASVCNVVMTCNMGCLPHRG